MYYLYQHVLIICTISQITDHITLLGHSYLTVAQLLRIWKNESTFQCQ